MYLWRSFLEQPGTIRTFTLGSDYGAHLVAHVFQICLEPMFHIFGQIGAAAPNLLHFFPLAFTGEVKGHLMGKQVVDPVQEFPGDRFDPVQRIRKVVFALPEQTPPQKNS